MKVLAQNRTRAFDKKAVVKCAAAVALLIAASKVSFAIGPVPSSISTLPTFLLFSLERFGFLPPSV